MSTSDPDLSAVLTAYQDMLARIDQLAASLFRLHQDHLRCRKGCYYCCTRISVTPIEYAWMSAALSALRERGENQQPGGPDAEEPAVPEIDRFIQTIPDDSELAEARKTPRCAVLKRGVCSMYHARPVICRIHGLPLAYPVFEYDEKGHRVLADDPDVALVWCDLNFTTITPSETLGEGEIIRMAEIHNELDAINSRFLATAAGKPFRSLRHGQLELDSVLDYTRRTE